MKTTFSVCIFLSALVLAGSLALAETGTYKRCISGCPDGEGACAQCCEQSFGAAFATCVADYQACTGKTRDKAAQIACSEAFNSCRKAGDPGERSFNCPGWQTPKCQYDCQKWNEPAGRCVGAPMNGCY
ncbi:MAG: hypothetical protein H0S85_04915 [Desulfovibrionaceae bacterium]|nr:hypothetical protein [Desulfovibrionaceae bacterium]